MIVLLPARKHFPDGALHSSSDFLGKSFLKILGDKGCSVPTSSDPFRSSLDRQTSLPYTLDASTKAVT
jgi:hypothetical protein